MAYKFHIKLDNDVYGPFTATEIMNKFLDSMSDFDDVEVMEESIGVWNNANDYPWDELVLKETGAGINGDGVIVGGGGNSGGGTYIPPTSSSQENNVTTSTSTSENDEPSIGLNILSFFFPIIGWILYFALDKGEKASSCAKWAWIGFGTSFAFGFISGLMGV